MGLIVNQEQKRTELQERIAAELRAKAEGTGLDVDDAQTDFVEGAVYVEDYEKKKLPEWVLPLVVVVLVFGLVVFGFVMMMRK